MQEKETDQHGSTNWTRKFKGLKLVISIDLESWKLCSKQLFQFCCCWQPPQKKRQQQLFWRHAGLLDQSVVLYHVWWTRCGFISCYPSSHWPFRAQLLVRQRWFREPSPSWGAHRPHGNSGPETGHCNSLHASFGGFGLLFVLGRQFWKHVHWPLHQ